MKQTVVGQLGRPGRRELQDSIRILIFDRKETYYTVTGGQRSDAASVRTL